MVFAPEGEARSIRRNDVAEASPIGDAHAHMESVLRARAQEIADSAPPFTPAQAARVRLLAGAVDAASGAA